MITIEKGDSKIVTTKDAFERQFKPLGYHIASKEDKGATEEVAPFVEKEEREEVREDKVKEEKEPKAKEQKEEEKLDLEFGFKKSKKGSK